MHVDQPSVSNHHCCSAGKWEAGKHFCNVMASMRADDVTIFVLRCNDIEVVQKTFEHYEKVTGVKINCDKSSILQLGALEVCCCSWAHQLNWQSHPHYWSVVQGGSPAVEELVESTGKGQSSSLDLAPKVIALKG